MGDTSLGGCVNIFHLDPEPIALLIKLRARMFAFADLPTLQKSTTNKFSMEPVALFNMLTSHIRPQRKGQLSLLEFRLLSEPLNMDPSELEKAFHYLDSGVSGSEHYVFVSDIAWLMKLPKTVDEHAVTFNGDIADVGQKRAMSKQTVDIMMPSGAMFHAHRPADMGDFNVHRPADAGDNCGEETASPAESPRAPSASEESTPVKIRAGPWKQKKRIQLRSDSPQRSPNQSPRGIVSAARSMWTRRNSDSYDCVCGHVLSGDANFCQKCGAKRLDPETEPPPNECESCE